MSCYPIPNHSLALCKTILNIPAPRGDTENSRLPNLKIGIIPCVLVPTPLISERVTGRKLEACTEIVVPVGGKVSLGLRVDLGELLTPNTDLKEEMGLEAEIMKQVWMTFQVVGSSLCLNGQ